MLVRFFRAFVSALVAAAMLLSPAISAQAVAQAKATKKPNVLFIMLDDLRMNIGIYGDPVAQTPNMDAFGKSGLVFDNAFTQQAVCGPSRAALLTGLRPDTTGIESLEQPVHKTVPNAVTLLQTFKNAGYATLGYGKVYHHRDDDPAGWTLRTTDAEYRIRQDDRKAKLPRLADDKSPNRDDLADTINVKMAMKDMQKYAKSGQPFFMAVGIHKPHLPFVSPESDWARYNPAKISKPVNPEGQKGAPPWALVAYEIWNYDDTKVFKDSQKMSPEKTQDLRLGYYAATSYADGLVGDLLDQLKKSGLEEDTIVVLWSDHGWKLGDHGKWAKHSNAELDIHIPMMIRVPGKTKAGSRSAAFVESVDIYPTLAELAGLKYPDSLEGLSMVPLLGNPGRPWKVAAFAQFDRKNAGKGSGGAEGYTVRADGFRYTAWVANSDKSVIATELYDLKKDPHETTNVAGNKAYSAKVKELEAIRVGGWKKVRDAVKL